LARLPSPRHAVYRRLRVPHRREEPLFPLGACWPASTTRTQSPREVPPARCLPYATHGIIQLPSPRSASRWRVTSLVSFPAAPFAACYVYNTVVLGAAGASGKAHAVDGAARGRNQIAGFVGFPALVAPGPIQPEVGVIFPLSNRRMS